MINEHEMQIINDAFGRHEDYPYLCPKCKYNGTDPKNNPCGWCGSNLNYEPTVVTERREDEDSD